MAGEICRSGWDGRRRGRAREAEKECRECGPTLSVSLSLSPSPSLPLRPRLMLRSLQHANRRLLSTSPRLAAPANSKIVTPPAPTVANSSLLRTTRDDSLWTPGLLWQDETEVTVGYSNVRRQDRELKEADLVPVENGGQRETEKMKYASRAPFCFVFTLSLTRHIDRQHVPGDSVCPPVSRARPLEHPRPASTEDVSQHDPRQGSNLGRLRRGCERTDSFVSGAERPR